MPPNSRTVSANMPRRCADTIFPTDVAPAITGRSAMFATHRGARRSSGSGPPPRDRPASGRTPRPESTAICSTSSARAWVSSTSRPSPTKPEPSWPCPDRSRNGVLRAPARQRSRPDRRKPRGDSSPCRNRSPARSWNRICGDAALRLCTEPDRFASTRAATIGPRTTDRPRHGRP
ncbi:hypothetical protein D3C87_1495700 [compost metagenome]